MAGGRSICRCRAPTSPIISGLRSRPCAGCCQPSSGIGLSTFRPPIESNSDVAMRLKRSPRLEPVSGDVGSARLPRAQHLAFFGTASELSGGLFRYILATSWRHQLALVLLTITVFLLEVVPLELQRRVV